MADGRIQCTGCQCPQGSTTTSTAAMLHGRRIMSMLALSRKDTALAASLLLTLKPPSRHFLAVVVKSHQGGNLSMQASSCRGKEHQFSAKTHPLMELNLAIHGSRSRVGTFKPCRGLFDRYAPESNHSISKSTQIGIRYGSQVEYPSLPYVARCQATSIKRVACLDTMGTTLPS